jgi:hypothetical protein
MILPQLEPLHAAQSLVLPFVDFVFFVVNEDFCCPGARSSYDKQIHPLVRWN